MSWIQPSGIGVKIPSGNRVIITTNITILSHDNMPCGFITDFTPDSTRRVERVRILAASSAGRVVEQVPGPEDITLRVNGFAIYDATLLGIITKGSHTTPIDIFHCLNTQYIPFNITIEEIHPVPGGGTNDTIVTLFGDCWLANYSHPISIRNLYITETATIQPSYCKTLVPATESDVP